MSKHRDDMSDEELFVHKMNEFCQKHPEVRFDVSPDVLVCLIGALQLSLRHPHLKDPTREMVRTFVDGAINAVDRAVPGLGRLFRKGDDPSCDPERRG
jgi:hypothetical protein